MKLQLPTGGPTQVTLETALEALRRYIASLCMQRDYGGI